MKQSSVPDDRDQRISRLIPFLNPCPCLTAEPIICCSEGLDAFRFFFQLKGSDNYNTRELNSTPK